MRGPIIKAAFLPLTLALVTALPLPAAVHYVDVNSANPAPPFLTWQIAARTIQDAVDAAAPGDEIVVTNGVYATGGRAVYGLMTNRVAVDKPLTVRSVNGPQFTMIQGKKVIQTNSVDWAIRSVYLTNGALLSGFTLTNSGTMTCCAFTEQEMSGGGLYCESTDALVTNCVIGGNFAYQYGAGTYSGTLDKCVLVDNEAFKGGGAYRSVINGCTLRANHATDGAGASESTLNNCTLAGNWGFGCGGAAGGCALINCTLANNYGGYGGGACGGTLTGCVVSGNGAEHGGGAWYSTLNQCVLSDNQADFGGGAQYGTLNGCTLSGNSAHHGGGAYEGILLNCTLSENSAYSTEENDVEDRGSGGGAYGGTLSNCILYLNTARDGANYQESILNYCCTTPLPTSGFGHITNEPLFVDVISGNLRLQSNSPCINAGRNVYARAGTDLDSNPRIVGGTVDIGAYEFQSPASIISYAWLQQFGLPTDGSADFADPDGDGLNNWQEWRCGTEPTNRLSVLQLLPPRRVGSDVVVTWESVPGQSYFLEQSRNLRPQSRFEPLAGNIAAQGGTTTYTHTNAAGGDVRFYHVGVEQTSP